MARYLGIDIGTSAVKTVLVDERQRILAEAGASYDFTRPAPLSAEQDPALWLQAVESSLAALSKLAPDDYAKTEAIGLSGQMHGLTVLDRKGAPLRPSMLWNDGRAHAQARRLAETRPELAEIAGVLPMPGFTGPKALWLKENEPEIFERVGCVMTAKDVVRLELTGERLTDPSDAAGTWLYDETRQDWSDEILGAVGLSRSQTPALCESAAPAGRLSKAMAGRLGLAPGTLVAGGAGDCAAGAVGAGVVREGQALVSLGTGALIFTPSNSCRPAVDSLVHAFRHALTGTWYQMAAMLNGGSVLAFAARLCGLSPAQAAAAVEAGYKGPGELVFLPYLTGERTPHNDPHARGVLFGLTPDADAAAVAQAAMEGVAFTLAQAADILARAGADLSEVNIQGGGAKSLLWTRIIASLMGKPLIRRRDEGAGPAFGAARLARMASTGESAADVCDPPEILDVVAPEPDLARAYAPLYARFLALYPLLRESFRQWGGAGDNPALS